MKNPVVICILYNPSQEIIEKWRHFSEDYKACIFIDNSSEDKVNSRTRQLANYVALGENKGIAYAQNIGIKRAKELGYEYVVFFDQDSMVSGELIKHLKNEYEKIKYSNKKIGALGPSIKEINTGQAYKGSEIGSTKAQKVSSIISSGMLTEIGVLDKVGGMKEELFIDLVDHEWCWRAKEKGYDIYKSGSSYLYHQVGNKSVVFLNIPFIISSPIRYYFKYRNFIWLLSYRYVPIKWKMKNIVRKFVELLVIPLLATEKMATIKYIIKGIKDGCLNSKP